MISLVQSNSSSSSSGTPQNWSDESGDPDPKPQHQNQNQNHRTLAPNLTRRSHKKSRAGCFNCKSRKIKCQESRPSCDNCVLKDLECRYPTKTDQNPKRRIADGSSDLIVPASFVPPPVLTTSEVFKFTITDLKFFHHFLVVAHPHLPLGNEKVWVEQIPVFAQEHPYLMNAILALGASHLSRVNPGQDYTTQAIVHRGQAIEGLNNALNKTNRTYGESDAMLAACYALTFQASYMSDGMVDFITMVRGCALVSHQVMQEGSPTAFDIKGDVQLRMMNPRLDQLPTLDHDIVVAGSDALTQMQHLPATSMERQFHAALSNVMLALQQSSRTGYINFMFLYSMFYNMSNDDFALFISPTNTVTQMLLAYFVSVQLLMSPIAQYEWPENMIHARAEVLTGFLEWAEKIFETVPSDMLIYLMWPMDVVGTVRAEITNRGDPPGKILQMKRTTSTLF